MSTALRKKAFPVFFIFISFIFCSQTINAQQPVITSFLPTSAGSGTPVTITGKNLSGATAVSFGGTPSNFFYNIDSVTIRAYVGAGASGEVSVTTANGTSVLAGFTFIPPPIIDSFIPAQGYAGAAITINGSGFSDVYSVSFGNISAASFNILSDSVITAVVSTGASGNVVVTGPHGFATLGGFVFIGPEIVSFSPTFGGDGTLVTITGNNFLGTTAVSFGGVPAESFSVVSATVITAIVASESSGDVAVTTNYGTATVPGFNKPYIISFNPFIGGPGTIVNIKGFNFTNTSEVRFGDSTAKSFSILSDTIIQAVVGNGASGDVIVKALNDSAVKPFFFFSYQQPYITSFTPATAKFGTPVTIKGQHFTGTTSVSFGGVNAQSFSVISDSVIVATTGAGASGRILITALGGTGGIDGFQYLSTPVITAFAPASGPAGTSVIVTGGHFNANKDSNNVFFGAVKAKVIQADTGQLVVEAPYGAGYQAITVAINGYITSSPGSFQLTFAGGLPSFSDSSFETRIDIPAKGTSPEYLAAGDFDGDGKTDLVVSDGLFSNKQSISVYKNISQDAKIAFAEPMEYAISTDTLYNSLPVLTADIDADGKLDLVVTNTQQNTVSILRNVSAGGQIKFAEKKDFTVDSNVGSEKVSPGSATIADFDGDGKLDLAFSHYGGIGSRGKITVMRNLSTSSEILFGAKQFYNVENAWRISTGDFNNDNKPDIAVAVDSYTGTIDAKQVYILGNTSIPGQIAFQTADIIGVHGISANSLGIADLNGDKRDDITAMNNNTRTVSIFHNITTSFYTTFERSIEDTLDYQTRYSAINDINGDGKPDLAVSNASNKVSLLENKSTVSTIAFDGKQEYLTPTRPEQVLLVDLDNDGRPDMVAANSDSAYISIFRNKIGEPQIAPAGEHPVVGRINKKVMVDSAVISYNGSVFVQRHYDIEPENNPETSTAKVTLYFTQQEFNNFNAHPTHGTDLPKSPIDTIGKANIRIYQYHGSSATGMPGTYSGDVIEINPADSSVKWNADAECWELTFNVTGFSGFFLSSEGNKVLPVKILNFTASLSSNKTALLKWQTAQEINTSFFNILRSTNGINFTNIKKVMSVAENSNTIISYNYQDSLEELEVKTIYYKLIEMDRDGKTFYSNVVPLNLKEGAAQLKLYPNPAKQYIIIEHPSSLSTAQLIITDMAGHVVKATIIAKGVEKTTMNLHDLAAGAYYIKWISKENNELKNSLLFFKKN